jgi:ABC-type dipeptide/oligopeptide/nickel transport system ATPase component
MEVNEEIIDEEENALPEIKPAHIRSIPKMGKREQYYYRKYAIIRYIRRRIISDRNCLIMITGSTGSGKSFSALSISEMLNEDFNIHRLVFKGRELMKLVNDGTSDYRKGIVIVWDEAGIDLSNRNWYSVTNRVLSFLLQTFRHKNFILIFTVPYEDFVDSATKKLFHAQFETAGINRANNTCALKPKFLQYNPEKKKWYRKYLKVSKNGGRKKVKIRRWNVPKPSEELIKAYEEKKNYFTKILNHEIEASLSKLEGEGFEEKKPLNESQTKILELWKMGITKPKKIISILDIKGSEVSRIYGILFKKGYRRDLYGEDKNVTEEYIKDNKQIIIDKLNQIINIPIPTIEYK